MSGDTIRARLLRAFLDAARAFFNHHERTATEEQHARDEEDRKAEFGEILARVLANGVIRDLSIQAEQDVHSRDNLMGPQDPISINRGWTLRIDLQYSAAQDFDELMRARDALMNGGR